MHTQRNDVSSQDQYRTSRTPTTLGDDLNRIRALIDEIERVQIHPKIGFHLVRQLCDGARAKIENAVPVEILPDESIVIRPGSTEEFVFGCGELAIVSGLTETGLPFLQFAQLPEPLLSNRPVNAEGAALEISELPSVRLVFNEQSALEDHIGDLTTLLHARVR